MPLVQHSGKSIENGNRHSHRKGDNDDKPYHMYCTVEGKRALRASCTRSTLYASISGVIVPMAHLIHDVQAGGNLPDEEAYVDGVQRDVRVASEVVALLHVRHQCSCCSPEDHDSRAGVQVRTRE